MTPMASPAVMRTLVPVTRRRMCRPAGCLSRRRDRSGRGGAVAGTCRLAAGDEGTGIARSGPVASPHSVQNWVPGRIWLPQPRQWRPRPVVLIPACSVTGALPLAVPSHPVKSGSPRGTSSQYGISGHISAHMCDRYSLTTVLRRSCGQPEDTVPRGTTHCTGWPVICAISS
jgi:hypothetical protein